jgi:hypothetical protein
MSINSKRKAIFNSTHVNIFVFMPSSAVDAAGQEGSRSREPHTVARRVRSYALVLDEQRRVLTLKPPARVVRRDVLPEQLVDLDVLLLVHPRPARERALIEPVGRPQEGGLDELLSRQVGG